MRGSRRRWGKRNLVKNGSGGIKKVRRENEGEYKKNRKVLEEYEKREMKE